MNKLDQRFFEDRAMRDAAREVLKADIAHARTSLSPKGLADRIGGRIGDGAKDVFEVTKTHAEDNKGIIAILVGAILLWFARQPILEILGVEQDTTDESPEAPAPDCEAAEDNHPNPTPAEGEL